ncbi:hypothetical protein BC629DRAFT_945070 [Irpex lacteus]|nr:hypothetical protein BC629DRAFT_945070 [Irpex lacteus]
MVMIATCMVMYAMATAHWGIMFNWSQKVPRADRRTMSQDIQIMLRKNASAAGECLETLLGSLSSTPGVVEGNSMPIPATTALLTVNVILSDTIVLYRAYTIWGNRRFIQTISIVFLFTLIGCSGFNLWSSTFDGQDCLFCSVSGLLIVGISLMLNLWATSIIGYKAWIHKRVVRKYLATGNKRTRSEKLLALFVDSGMLYTMLWVFLMGMYPTVLVAAVSIERLTGNQTIQTVHGLTQNAPSGPVPPPVHIRVDLPLVVTKFQYHNCLKFFSRHFLGCTLCIHKQAGPI